MVDHADREDKRSLADLVSLMAALRTPVTGCPWDLEQTFATIAPYTIEEAYEVADAIERWDMPDLKDELGDLLFQVVYHSRMAEEAGAFGLADVVDQVTRKMLRRHPHVFGTTEERAAGPEPGFWERIKSEERAAKTAERTAASLNSASTTYPRSDRHRAPRTLDGVPVGLPGLTRAVKLQDKAARVGFDWPSLGPVLDKVREEIAELDEAVTAGDTANVAEEFGDLLFVMANVARHLKIDPETALRAANAKFTRRFAFIEDCLAADGRSPAQSDLTEMDRLWELSKAAE